MVLFGVGKLVKTVQTRSENYIFSCFPPEFLCAWRWGPPCCHIPMPMCPVAVTLWQISVLSVTKQKEKQAYVVFLLCFHCTQTALSNQLNDGVQKVRCLFFPNQLLFTRSFSVIVHSAVHTRAKALRHVPALSWSLKVTKKRQITKATATFSLGGTHFPLCVYDVSFHFCPLSPPSPH